MLGLHESILRVRQGKRNRIIASRREATGFVVARIDGGSQSGSAIYYLIWGIFLNISTHQYRSCEMGFMTPTSPKGGREARREVMQVKCPARCRAQRSARTPQGMGALGAGRGRDGTGQERRPRRAAPGSLSLTSALTARNN